MAVAVVVGAIADFGLAGQHAGTISVCAIGLAVAVIVYSITTRFERRCASAKLAGCPAGFYARATARSGAVLGGAHDASESFVDLAVAIVVETIANLSSEARVIATR